MIQMNADSTFTFGKHKGSKLNDVIHDDVQYVTWCRDNNIITLDDSIIDKYIYYKSLLDSVRDENEDSLLADCMGLYGGGQGY